MGMPIMPERVVQEFLADGMRRPVGGDADRLAQLVEKRVELLQGIPGHVPVVAWLLLPAGGL